MSNDKNIKIIDERNTGVYLWMTEDGVVQDDEGHFLSLPSRKGDVRRANIMIQFIKNNYPEHMDGCPVWTSNRQVTDEEFDHQFQRGLFGLTPDPLDDYIQEVKDGKRSL